MILFINFIISWIFDCFDEQINTFIQNLQIDKN